MATAYTDVEQSLADALDSTDLKPGRAQEGQALKALCKELAEQTKVISDDYANALDRDKAKEDDSKLEFRGQLQSALSNFALQFGKLDDGIARAAREWGVEADKATPTTDAVVAGVVVAQSPAEAQPGATPAPAKNDLVEWRWIVNKGTGHYLWVTSDNRNAGN